jgi:hypothetical protein
MRVDPPTDIIKGIQAYLQTHFPTVQFSVKPDPDHKRVLLESGERPRYRLEVTDRFLAAEEGTAKSLQRVQEWDLAGVLRAAGTKRVTLATTGLHTEVRPHWRPPSPRR